MRGFAAAAAAMMISACSIQVPVTGYIGDAPALGQAEGRANGDGTFYAMTTDGLRCGGHYDSLDTNPTITAPVSCSDGRTGTIIITRSTNLLSGTAIAELKDGTKGRFVFGNLAFSQGTAGAAAIAY